MTLTHIRLELGRMEGFPNGSAGHGYEFVAPLTKDGFIDSKAWRDRKEECWVRRFWGDEPEEHGLLKHRGQHSWYFDYNKRDTSDDEPFFKLDKHRLVKDTYVSVREHDDVQRPFKVVALEPVRDAAA